jgi:probable rRNA maturation factor
MALVVNLQRKIKLDLEPIKEFCERLRKTISDAGDKYFSVAFVSDRRMKELNSFFRGKAATTDVLSFPHEADEFDADDSNLGDIVISVEQAQRQALDNGLSIENEIQQLILHGILHLSGYDHETDDGEMNKRELQLRRKLKI